ncbi:hypothetical protein M5689_003343 [Euphorbia peplus]|nr:hypothetical protein M5689_003343 [Euphorbia peplus]
MLLTKTFPHLSLNVGENAFAKPKGGLWLFQLWVLAYFPDLTTEMPVESLGNLSIDLCCTSSELPVSSIVRFFRSLVSSSMNELFRFQRVNETHLRPSAISYISTLTLKETEWWLAFCTARKLHYGVACTKSSRSSDPGLVLYGPCVWARQLGFFKLYRDILTLAQSCSGMKLVRQTLRLPLQI